MAQPSIPDHLHDGEELDEDLADITSQTRLSLSSASSGNRTARQSRSSSSATIRNLSAGGLFGRIRRRGKEDDYSDEDEEAIAGEELADTASPIPARGWRTHLTDDQDNEVEAGPSDYHERETATPSTPTSSSLPPSGWRQPSTQPFDPDALEEGPSDYWGAGTPPVVPAYLHESTPSTTIDSPVINEYDDDEYERRIRDVMAHNAQSTPGTNSPNLSVSESFPYHPSQIHGNRLHGRAHLDEKADSGIGEEEFGRRKVLIDDVSEATPSVASATPSKLQERYAPGSALSPSKRTSFIHPSVSRLRSHMRSSSSATQQSVQHPQLLQLRAPSHFSQIDVAKSETMSTTSAPLQPSNLPVQPPNIPRNKAELNQGPAFQFHPLRKLSAHLFARQTNGTSSPRPDINKRAGSVLKLPLGSPTTKEIPEAQNLGKPTVMDIRGMIAVGTDRGYIVVYGFGQEIKYILGPEEPNETYIAVGFSSGSIYLYDLSSPSSPARTAHFLTLKQIQSGRREGHLEGSRILHIGFVGARHTSIVSGDEHGRAFWWSLGKVMGVESTDVIRMLGSYPSGLIPTTAPPYPAKRPTTLFSASPLPLGDSPHPTDKFSLSALLTPSKLVIVGMKPQAKTWFRKMRDGAGGDQGAYTGCTSWLRSGEVGKGFEKEVAKKKKVLEEVSDPVIAYSWGKAVRFVRVRVQEVGDDVSPDFVEGRKWEAGESVKFLDWYDSNHLLVITVSQLTLLDVRSMKAVEETPLQTQLLTSQDFYSGLSVKGIMENVPKSFAGSTKSNLQVGTLLHWNDRILSQVHRGDFLSAINVALSYYNGTATGNTINLPFEASFRKEVVGKRIKELMKASLEWAFSPDRMSDDTHYSADGRGVDLTDLFEGLAASCIEACLDIGDTDFLFNDSYEHFSQMGIQGIFLHILEPFIFSGRLREVPPDIIKALITMHSEKGELDQAESMIWHVEPMSLDINQAITLCEAHGLWDAMIHVYTRAMRDYVAPIVKLIGVVRDIQQHRSNRPSLVRDERDGTEEMAPNAYKLYSYIETVLSGLSYPSGEALPEIEAHQAQTEVYTFIFQGRTVAWPQGGHDLVLTMDSKHSEPPYPYLSLLLHFDTEAFLHAMDIAFEDSYLNDPTGAINRQSIVNLMLDVMDPEYFHPGDITLLHIFVARNLPKYPQFLFIPPSTLHRILVSLASDPDQSTREDRQLAAEYLLSAYTPHDGEAMLSLFETAGFFRILSEAYRREGKWGKLISTLLRDPESDDEVFTALEEIIKTATPSAEVNQAVVDALPHLFDLGVRETAILLDKELSNIHPQAIQALGHAPHKQMAYLRCLLEPDPEETHNAPSSNIDLPSRHLYITLLAQHDPGHIVSFLDERGPSSFDLPRLVDQLDEAGLYEAELWALDRQGKVKETFVKVGDVLRTKGGELGEGLVNDDVGSVHLALETIQGVAKMAVRLCREHSSPKVEGRNESGRGAMEVEDMWLGVLHEIIELVHTSSALTSISSDTVVLDTLRSLVQETLSSLVSSSSPSLSFPRLFKRLVDASTTTTKQSSKGRAYSEFRTILMGMLDSYRAEGEMLNMTTKLVEADLGEVTAEFVEKSMRGWRAEGGQCGECGKNLKKDQSWVVLGSGSVLHKSCFQV
ncbi:hypothetical protein CNBF1360 [Cryptococcus deneoformans B-3501A]|uniref:hypothetical protein n=1 Tax=Cryptococcus deneoformans (strain B-3501A) TaxID=283643 RepID=UPI00004302DF|nr:hypothetical protein CNBF1360 [Cryptococcus neoformans var. neoformans B-3501A]EAL20325.1 hypothetical protein CNBF1360 [Cryptococcus neoformans var. neoformans B-3501A]